MPKRSQKGSQNELKIVKNRLKRGSRERSRLKLEKRLDFGPSGTLSGGFSCKREHSFHFFTLAQKSIQKGAQKLSKWRPGALKMLSGERLKNILICWCIFGSFGGPKWSQNELKIGKNEVSGELCGQRGLPERPRGLQRIILEWFGVILGYFFECFCVIFVCKRLVKLLGQLIKTVPLQLAWALSRVPSFPVPCPYRYIYIYIYIQLRGRPPTPEGNFGVIVGRFWIIFDLFFLLFECFLCCFCV
jgi:hypothetical protein